MDFISARKNMVDCQVHPNDVTNLPLLEALLEIPKEQFLPGELKSQAYVEKELHYAPGRSQIPARDFGKLLQYLSLKPTDLVLDVACGSGYSTAVLARICEMVVAVETDESLVEKAEGHLVDLGIGNAAIMAGDLRSASKSQGPFDAIVICGVIETAPNKLLAQLKDDGKLGAFQLDNGVCRAFIYHKSGDVISVAQVFAAATTNVIPDFVRKKEFQF